MTEKIVQLTDDENNNIYPVAGSLKDGSVTTSTINDGAVTADKIDFTTLEVKTGSVKQGTTDLDITDGTWLIYAYCTVLASGSESELSLRKNNTSVQVGFFGNNVTNTWGNIKIISVIEKTSGDTVTLYAAQSSDPISIRSRWIAVRLGAATVVS